jgi:hypothetical protein
VGEAWSGSATFDTTRRHRFTLTRTAPGGAGRVVFIGLNPSTADALVDDPTIRKCRGFVERMGYGELCMVNLFSLRSTDPRWLLEPEALTHWSENENAVLTRAESAEVVVCAWGGPYAPRSLAERIHARAGTLLTRLRAMGRTPHVLGLTKDGHPRHPLYMPYTAMPRPWR